MTEIAISRRVEVPFGGRLCRSSDGRPCFLLRGDTCAAAAYEQNPDPVNESAFEDSFVMRRRRTVVSPEGTKGGCPNVYTSREVEQLASG